MLVHIVTCAHLPHVDADDAPLVDALARRGSEARVVVWDDSSVDWAAAPVAVIRSAWDYHLRRDEFVAWAERVETKTRLFNDAATVRWNSHKRYLKDLEARGVRIIPTAWIDRGSRADLADIAGERGWDEVVIKPAISANAHLTARVRARSAEGRAHLEKLTRASDAMVQPYFGSVDAYGERSIVVIDGEVTHAARKQPALTGKDEPEASPAPIVADEARMALDAIRAASRSVLYARVDVARDERGEPCLMELEMIEPTLFLRHGTAAAARMADAIVRAA